MRERRVVRRKPADARKSQLAQLVKGGITDPSAVAAQMGISTNAVLKYANGMDEIAVVPVKLNGTGRIMVQLQYTKPLAE
jgi:hypothetical protein